MRRPLYLTTPSALPKGLMKRAVKWTLTDIDPLEKCSLVDVDQKSAVVDVDGIFHNPLYGKTYFKMNLEIRLMVAVNR